MNLEQIKKEVEWAKESISQWETVDTWQKKGVGIMLQLCDVAIELVQEIGLRDREIKLIGDWYGFKVDSDFVKDIEAQARREMERNDGR